MTSGFHSTAATVAALATLTLAFSATPAQAQDSKLARSLAATCANCHGTNGNARSAMAPLAGVPADKIVAAFNGFKTGQLPATVMHQISKGYTDAQVQLIAAYFAAQTPAK